MPHNIYVDDDLITDIGRRMPFALAAAAGEIFKVMGAPAEHLRQCAVALDKWRLLIVAHKLVMLGFIVNTHSMTIRVTENF